MKKNSLLLWILIPISCMTNYIVYAESVDPLDPGVVVEEPTPTDLIEPDPVPDPTIQDEEEPIVDVWGEEEPVDVWGEEEPVEPWEEEPVDSLEPLLDPVEVGETPIGGGLQSALGGLQSALGGLQSATPPTITPTSTSTSEEPQADQPVITNTTSSNLIDPTSTGISEEPQIDQPVITNTTSINLIDLTSTGTDEQSNFSTSNQTANTSTGTSEEPQINQPVLANTTSSNLIDSTSTGTDEQSNSSTSNPVVNTGSNTSEETQINQPVITNTASGNLNESGTLIENSTQTTSSSDKNKTPTATTRNSSTNSSNTTNSNSSQSNLSSSTRSNNTASTASSTQSKSNVSSTTTSTSLPKSTNQDKTDGLTTTTPQNNSSKKTLNNSTKSTTADNTDDNNTSTNPSVQDNIVTTKQNASTTTDDNPAGNSNLSKGELSTTPKISPVSSSHAPQEETLNESNNEPGIQTSANENKSQVSTPKSEANEEGGTTQLQNDRVVIVADNSVLPNTFSVDAQIGPHQVFLINIGEGYSKPEVVEHLNNSQVFIKENLLTYVPNLGFVGIDTFSYQVTDPEGKRVVRQVRVKVTAKDELVPVKNCQLYFVNDGGDSDSQFLTVAPTSKIAIKLGPEYYTFDMEGMAIHPTNGLLYATSGGGKQNIFDGYLYRVNSETGGVTIMGDTGFSEISSLAFRPDGTLWSWSRKGSKDKSKPAGLIQIDPTTAQSQLIFASPVDIEGLAWDSEGKVLYGTEQTRLWAFDGKELHKQCSNLSSEIEALETSVNGMLLLGTNEYNGSAIHLYDPAICEEVIGDSFAIPSVTGNFDIESIAWSLECQAAITKTTRSDKDSDSTKLANANSDNKECTDKDKSNCSTLAEAEVDNKKETRNSKKVTSQPVTTCPTDTIGPCPALKPEEVQRFFTDNLKADFVQLDPDGLVFVSLNGQLHYGFFSYSLSAEQVNKLKLKPVYEVACEKNESSVAQLKLSLTKDVDVDGHSDFVIAYCDGQAQMLFYLGITDSVLTGMDDLETSNKSNSNAIKKEDMTAKKGNSTQTKN
jgi:hypothetical protein